MQVKVCGVRTSAGAKACAEAGVDLVGFNFVRGARRSIDIEQAAALTPDLGDCVPVGLFRDSPVDEVRAVASTVGIEWIQLHGDEDAAYCRKLAGEFRLIKAVEVSLARDPAQIGPFAGLIDVLLVDGKRPGTGTRWDWSALAECRRLLAGVPVFLAGGLHPWNVGRAIAVVQPDGVDTATGVERDGQQAADLIAAFVANARGGAVQRLANTPLPGATA